MKRYKKEIIKLTAKEVLLSIFDLALPVFLADRNYRVGARKYLDERQFERSKFLPKIYYLKQQGLIENFVEGKEKYFEITPKGLKKILKVKEETISRPEYWDGKWRVVIFDIPEKRKSSRDMIRRKLIKLGFEQIQESVYVYPFECTDIITKLSIKLLIEKNVLIMISEIIQGENQIVEHFLSKGVLTKTDIQRTRNKKSQQ